MDTCTEGLSSGGADDLSGEKAVPAHTYVFAGSQSLKDYHISHSRRTGIVLSYGLIEKDS